MKQTAIATLGAVLLAVTLPVAAVNLEPGKWEITVSSQNPMTGQPIERTSTECLEQDNYDPAQLLADNQECRLLEMQDDGDTVTWKMECSMGEGMPAATAEGHFVSQGKTASGEMVMKMSFSGMSMELKNTWQGRHLGNKCD